jgi:hypothetical protein
VSAGPSGRGRPVRRTAGAVGRTRRRPRGPRVAPLGGQLRSVIASSSVMRTSTRPRPHQAVPRVGAAHTGEVATGPDSRVLRGHGARSAPHAGPAGASVPCTRRAHEPHRGDGRAHGPPARDPVHRFQHGGRQADIPFPRPIRD